MHGAEDASIVASHLNGLDFGAYAPMVRHDKYPLLLYPCGNELGLQDEGYEGSVPMLDILHVEQRRRYLGDEVLHTDTDEELAKTSECLMVKRFHRQN